MGCFSTCFGNSKRQPRSPRRPIKTTPCLLDHLQTRQSVEDFQWTHLIEDETTEKPIDPSPQSNDDNREKANLSERKKVTFDLNVKVYEELPTEEEVSGNPVRTSEEEDGERNKEQKASESQCSSDSCTSSVFSYPPNHRYQNCRDSDDEFDDILSSDGSDIDDDYTDDDDDDDYNEGEIKTNNDKSAMGAQDQLSESLFSLSLDSRKHHNLGNNEGGDKEVNSPIPINNPRYVDSVLNPVENLSQWKVIKARSRLSSRDHHHRHRAKENLEKAQDFEVSAKKEQFQKEIGVDTSLSSWLVGSEATPNSKTSSVNNSAGNSTFSSPKKFEDRPILGALTVEEIRQISAASSPRKSPSKSPDDMPIIGTVGSYWSHTGQSTESVSSTRSRSRFSESAKVIWDSTPFEERLEKALEKEGNSTEHEVLRV